MRNDLHFRWLGVCGIELTSGKHTLLVDPYFTRLKAHHLWVGRPTPNRRLIRGVIERADHILVTHPHFDHLLDVAEIAEHTGAIVHGSPNTVELLRMARIPKKQIRLLEPGQRFSFGDFHIEALPAPMHSPPGYGPGTPPSSYKLPLHAYDFRMDYMMSFLIKMRSLRLLFGITETPIRALPVDILFLEAYAGMQNTVSDHYRQVMNDFHPRLVIPIHADDMMVPLSKPVIGQMLPQKKIFFPLRRFSFNRFAHFIENHASGSRAFLPVRLENYELNTVLDKMHPLKRSSFLHAFNPHYLSMQILRVITKGLSALHTVLPE